MSTQGSCCCNFACDQTYYVMYPVCGSDPGSCQKMAIADATANGMTKGDHIRESNPPSSGRKDVYLLECSNNPPAECVGSGTQDACINPSNLPDNEPQGTTRSASDFQKCGLSCGDCASEGFPDVNALKTCAESYGDCYGTHFPSSHFNGGVTPTDPMNPPDVTRCLDFEFTDVSIASTCTRYPRTTLNVTSVHQFDFRGCHWESGFGSFWDGQFPQYQSIFIIDYNVDQQRDSCCDLDPSDPAYCDGTGDFPTCCTDREDCNNGRMFLYVKIDEDQDFSVGDASNILFGDDPTPEAGITQSAADCGGGLTMTLVHKPISGQGDGLQRDPPFPTDKFTCVPCSAFNYSNTYNGEMRLDPEEREPFTPGNDPICDFNSSGTGFALSISFSVTATGVVE